MTTKKPRVTRAEYNRLLEQCESSREALVTACGALKGLAKTLDVGINSSALLTPIGLGVIESRAKEAIEALRAKRSWEHEQATVDVRLKQRVERLESAARDVVQAAMFGQTMLGADRHAALAKLANILVGRDFFTAPISDRKRDYDEYDG